MKTPTEIGTATLTRLTPQAARNKAAGSALRAEIRAAMVSATEPEMVTAKGIRNRLSRVPLPSLRTIQGHMKAIRAESSASR